MDPRPSHAPVRDVSVTTLSQYARLALPSVREARAFARRVRADRLELYRRLLADLASEAPQWTALQERVGALQQAIDAAVGPVVDRGDDHPASR